MRATIELFAMLPGVLRITWALLLLGMVALAAGRFTHTRWRSYAGLGCLILDPGLALRAKRKDKPEQGFDPNA